MAVAELLLVPSPGPVPAFGASNSPACFCSGVSPPEACTVDSVRPVQGMAITGVGSPCAACTLRRACSQRCSCSCSVGHVLHETLTSAAAKAVPAHRRRPAASGCNCCHPALAAGAAPTCCLSCAPSLQCCVAVGPLHIINTGYVGTTCFS